MLNGALEPAKHSWRLKLACPYGNVKRHPHITRPVRTYELVVCASLRAVQLTMSRSESYARSVCLVPAAADRAGVRIWGGRWDRGARPDLTGP